MNQIKLPIVILLAILVSIVVVPARAETPAAASLEQRLDAIVTDMFPAPDEPGLAVLVMVDGKPVLRKGYGLSDLKSQAKVTPDSIFRIGSMTKQFTAVAVLQLVQAGKVSLSDPITKYVPDLDTHGQTITIENLLTHTSGLPNVTAMPEFDAQQAKDVTSRESIALVEGKPLEFNPGEQFKYSNTNYLLLGMVIEKASGQSYAEYLQDHICKPLGLNDTRYSRDDAFTPRHARGYEFDEKTGKWGPARAISMTQPYAAGAIESTVDDLAKWTAAVSEGKVVDPSLVERAWTPFTPAQGPARYGYGWGIRTDSGERWIGHGGGINGYMSDAVWIPEKKVFVAVLRNGLGDVTPKPLLRQLALEAVGRPMPRRVAITLTPETLEQYVGVYEMSPDFKMTVTREGQCLFVQATDQRKAEIFAEAEGKFFAKVVDAQFEFHVDGGRATSLTLHQNGRENPARRVEE